MKLTHMLMQPLFSVVFLSKVTLSGLTKGMNLLDDVNLTFNFLIVHVHACSSIITNRYFYMLENHNGEHGTI